VRVSGAFETAAPGGGSSGPRRPQEASERVIAAINTMAGRFGKVRLTNKLQKERHYRGRIKENF
jgi:hypothetical protein